MPFTYKNKSDRLTEVVKVLKQIRNLGFPEKHEGILEINKILKEYVNTGGYKKGKIKLTGYERVIQYELYVRKGVEIAVNLKYIKGL